MQVAVARVAPAARLQAVAAADLDRLLDRLAPAGRAARRCPRPTLPPRSATDRERHAFPPAPEPGDSPAPGRGRPARSRRAASASSSRRRAASSREPSASADDHEAAPVGSSPGTAACRRERAASRYSSAAARARRRPRVRSPSQPVGHAAVEPTTGMRGLRRRDEPEPGSGDDPERPFRADQQALQVVAGHVLADRAADARSAPPARRPPPARSPSAPVTPYLNACGPARVRGDVAADLRLLGALRVGREEQAALACEPPDVAGRTPASTCIRQSRGSKARTRSSRSRRARRRPGRARRRPRSRVPPPRGTIGTSCS